MLWYEKSNLATPYDFVSESQDTLIELPLVDESAIVKIISGNLPPGLHIDENKIKGIPTKAGYNKNYEFTLRATFGNEIEDCSFILRTRNKPSPIWITPPGKIDINDEGAVFDGFDVKFQFSAINEDGTNHDLKFVKTGGEIPFGLTLEENGLLHGMISSFYSENNDDNYIRYDVPYPHPDYFIPGYSSKFYDSYDQNELSHSISYTRKTQKYLFEISVYDNRNNPVSREFEIVVVGNKELTLDMMGLVEEYDYPLSMTSGSTGLIWMTPSNLGFFQDNKLMTYFLDCYDPKIMTGYVKYTMPFFNPDMTINMLPKGLKFDNIRGIIFGKIPKHTKPRVDYTFTIYARSYVLPELDEGVDHDMYSVSRTFTMSIVNNDYSMFTWKTQQDLGDIYPYERSMFNVTALTSNKEMSLRYKLVDGELPPGLFLRQNGDIIGSVEPVLNDDGDLTNGLYEFSINVSDLKNIQGSTKKFTIYVDKYTSLLYTDVKLRPKMNMEMSLNYIRMMTDTSIIKQEDIYRKSDPNFGICFYPEIILYSGIQASPIEEFDKILEQFSRVRLKIEGIRYAKAYIPGTYKLQYEVVYMLLTDPKYSGSVDETKDNLFGLRAKIEKLGDTDLRQERLWMRSIQPETVNQELGTVLAIPLLYCKPGSGKRIARSLVLSNHDIYQYDIDIYEIYIDRTIDSDIPISRYFNNIDQQRFV